MEVLDCVNHNVIVVIRSVSDSSDFLSRIFEVVKNSYLLLVGSLCRVTGGASPYLL